MAAFSGSSPLRLAYLMIKPSLAESPPSRLLRETEQCTRRKARGATRSRDRTDWFEKEGSYT